MTEQRSASGVMKPPRLEDLDLDRYAEAGFGIGVITKWFGNQTPSRGVHSNDPDRQNLRPIQGVVAEVKDLRQRLGLSKFFFIANGFNGYYTAIQYRPPRVDEKRQHLQAHSGRHLLEVGRGSRECQHDRRADNLAPLALGARQKRPERRRLEMLEAARSEWGEFNRAVDSIIEWA